MDTTDGDKTGRRTVLRSLGLGVGALLATVTPASAGDEAGGDTAEDGFEPEDGWAWSQSEDGFEPEDGWAWSQSEDGFEPEDGWAW